MENDKYLYNYIFRTVNAGIYFLWLFSTLIPHHFSICEDTFRCLHNHSADAIYEVRGFQSRLIFRDLRTFTSFQTRHVTIDLFCSLILLYPLRRYRCAKLIWLFRANNFGKSLPIQCTRKIIGENRARKCAITSCFAQLSLCNG